MAVRMAMLVCVPALYRWWADVRLLVGAHGTAMVRRAIGLSRRAPGLSRSTA